MIAFTIPGRPFAKQRPRFSRKRVDDETLLSVYKETGSVWKTGEIVGLCGQSVHERVKKLGASRGLNVFTDADRDRLIREYEGFASSGKLSELAESMGRTKQFIARQARSLGLTNSRRSRPYAAEVASRNMKNWISKNGHPRGALGMKHADETKEKIRKKSVEFWGSLSDDEKSEITMRSMKARVSKHGTIAPKRNGATWKAGWREIGGIKKYYRSRWEANYARYLDWLKNRGDILDWAHEPETFWFDNIKRGVRSYLPDFRVWENDGSSRLHEVKGWMDARSKTTLRRMRKYHPQETIILIDELQYRVISKKVSGLIDGWE